MVNVQNIRADQLGCGFIPAEYLPPGEDEYYLRNQQADKTTPWRPLRADEIEALVKNGNTCANWDLLLVGDPFDPHQVKNSEFAGLVRIGRLQNVVLEYHELQAPAGIVNSRLVSCDVGVNCAIHNVPYLAHYIVGDHVMLLNVDEIQTTNHAKFGNGIIKDGEEERVRIWMEVMNETAARAVIPFNGMTCADAYIWAKYRDDGVLQRRLAQITQQQFDSRRGFYGSIGDHCVIKSTRVIKDVRIGPACYIKGANKLKNLTIRSSEEEPTQIGEGVELVNGIIGLGCRIFYGCKAVRFVMGGNSDLKYGARLLNSYLGDNSTVSCCELLNNLIFPGHEQHHNNSFLTGSLLLGQSNLAAGVTIGSNHNSRANDGEIQAGRGFWPGLCVTLKHNCRFASYVLLVQGSYLAELDIPLPFCLVSNDIANDRLVVKPAYWWLNNMYALTRNAWKFAARDTRKTRSQHIEQDALAPDTVEEIFTSLALLERMVGKAALLAHGRPLSEISAEEMATEGRRLLMSEQDQVDGRLLVLGEDMEHSKRPVVIVKPHKAYHAYRQMIYHYAMKHFLNYLWTDPAATRDTMCKALGGPRQRNWVNLGGQLVPEPEVARMLADIKSGALASWHDIHERYDTMWRDYPRQKRAHALACLLELLQVDQITDDTWDEALDQAICIQRHIRDQVYATRQKDYDNPFRQITFRSTEEMKAVMGEPQDKIFVRQVQEETEVFCAEVEALRARQG